MAFETVIGRVWVIGRRARCCVETGKVVKVGVCSGCIAGSTATCASRAFHAVIGAVYALSAYGYLGGVAHAETDLLDCIIVNEATERGICDAAQAQRFID